jgi:ABC-type multidrug transport system ATPase subunit
MRALSLKQKAQILTAQFNRRNRHMIRSENLTKTFGRETTALKNLTCEIGEESIYGLIGSNGAGKSTS